jgi:hypothetical protein
MKILQHLGLSCSCCHEDGRRDTEVSSWSGHDHEALSGHRGSDRTHLHQPWRQVGRKETLDEEEDDAAEEESVLGFYPPQRCFIYKHILTGLHENKAHKIFTKELNSAHSRR